MPKFLMLSGPSASGKSTVAKELLATDANAVRINRDELRSMSLHKWTPKREGFIIEAEKQLCKAAAVAKYNIIIDDTNLTPKDENMWRTVATEISYEFKKIAVAADLNTCITRDARRLGRSRVGRAVIERQFLRGKLIQWPTDRKVVIFDIDGTLADLTHRTGWIKAGGTCPCCNGVGQHQSGVETVDYTSTPVKINYAYDACEYCEATGKLRKKNHDKFYSLVEKDTPIEIVVKWAQATASEYMNVIVSGRAPEKSEDGTLRWLGKHGVPFEHIFMRRANMHGPDDEEKQLILDMILASGLPKEQIAFVVDDRPNVVAMWRKNGIRVFPVRGRDDDEFYKPVESTNALQELESNEGQ